MESTSDTALLSRGFYTTPNKRTIQAIAKDLSNQKNDVELKKACDGFEELFVQKMLQVMRDSGEKSGLISGGHGEEIFQDMLDENYARLITQSGALGLSRMIYEHTKKYL